MLSKSIYLIVFTAYVLTGMADDENDTENLVKMCLFYGSASGHARTDPILSQSCASDHVHTFYGPQNFHPDTSYQDLLNTGSRFSSTPFVENQSLYWHPSIYRIAEDGSGEKTYTRIDNLDTSPYYRWDNSVLPRTEAFPPGFRMIAYSNNNLFIECCDIVNGEESCTDADGSVDFPQENCDFVGIALAMPTCWNGDLGIDNNHMSHMAYTVDGSVNGACPEGYDRRLPEIQLFVRIQDYQGKRFKYTLADESNQFHVDFMNGWQEGKLQNIIDNCEFVGGEDDYNPPCTCDEFLEESRVAAQALCDSDTRKLIIDEATDVVTELPRGTCEGQIIPKTWNDNPPTSCNNTRPDEDEDSEDQDSEDEDSEDQDSEDQDSEDQDSEDQDSEDQDSEDEDSEDQDSEDQDSEDEDSEDEESEDENERIQGRLRKQRNRRTSSRF